MRKSYIAEKYILFRRKQYGSNFNQCDVTGHQNYGIWWNNAK